MPEQAPGVAKPPRPRWLRRTSAKLGIPSPIRDVPKPPNPNEGEKDSGRRCVGIPWRKTLREAMRQGGREVVVEGIIRTWRWCGGQNPRLCAECVRAMRKMQIPANARMLVAHGVSRTQERRSGRPKPHERHKWRTMFAKLHLPEQKKEKKERAKSTRAVGVRPASYARINHPPMRRPSQRQRTSCGGNGERLTRTMNDERRRTNATQAAV
ncbi:hypothetical protein B0H16DRAFT_1475341 [Mycena metata]|uniref:Uncharacterized protein n=1 Tax=Mycena metata TaxID=1033252 RepID=A0AAD7HET6_9AGAR|nr:hypothetical protein B0H16DRAFT_1475341 [Mycena metata]